MLKSSTGISGNNRVVCISRGSLSSSSETKRLLHVLAANSSPHESGHWSEETWRVKHTCERERLHVSHWTWPVVSWQLWLISAIPLEPFKGGKEWLAHHTRTLFISLHWIETRAERRASLWRINIYCMFWGDCRVCALHCWSGSVFFLYRDASVMPGKLGLALRMFFQMPSFHPFISLPSLSSYQVSTLSFRGALTHLWPLRWSLVGVHFLAAGSVMTQ